MLRSPRRANPDGAVDALPHRASTARPRRAVVAASGFAVLIGAWLLIGIVGHEPWKQDETYVFGIILELLRSGDWVVPTLAGEPFMEKPPLYYLLAAACARLASPPLPLHDAARLASAIFTGVTLLCVARAARIAWGPGAALAACLLLAGCAGLVIPARQMLTDLALLAGFGVAFVGLVEAARDGRHAAIWFGTGAGIAFLGKGLIGPGALALAALLLLLDPDFRRATYLRTLATAAAFALPWIVIWPAALYVRSPDLFMEWFWDNNIGRFAGFSVPHLGAARATGFWWYTLPWVTFPVLPFAILALRRRSTPLQRPVRSVALACAGAFGAVLLTAASARETYALPLLVPISMLAASGMRPQNDRLDRTLACAAAAVLGAAILWLVLVWATRDHPGEIFGSLRVASLIPVTAPLPRTAAIWWAAISTMVLVGAAAALVARPAGVPRWLIAWVAGVDLALCALLVLWLPWLDHAKSYRQVFESIAQKVPDRPACLDSIGLGESERAMLDYVAAMRTRRLEIHLASDCPWLMVGGMEWSPSGQYANGWTLVWSGQRPGDNKELFRIFHRQAALEQASAPGHVASDRL